MLSIDDSGLASLRSAHDVDEAFANAFESYRGRLVRAVRLRMDERVRARISPDDVVQDGYLDCAARIDAYLEDPPAALFLWVRYLVLQRLLQVHRRHIGRRKRDVEREIPLVGLVGFGASSVAVADALVASQTSPSRAFLRSEAKAQVREALERMDEVDREVLVLRHFEQLNSNEAAAVLGIAHEAARKRYLRALRRIREVFAELDDGDCERGR